MKNKSIQTKTIILAIQIIVAFIAVGFTIPVRLDTQQVQRDYYEGEIIDTNDIELYAEQMFGTRYKISGSDIQSSIQAVKYVNKTLAITWKYLTQRIDIQVHKVMEITGSYKSDTDDIAIYQGDAFNPEYITVLLKYDNGVYRFTDNYEYKYSSEYITNKSDVLISQTYGNTTISIEPVKIAYLKEHKAIRHLSGQELSDTSTIGNIDIVYEDGSIREIEQSEFKLVNQHTRLNAGINILDLDYHGISVKLRVNAIDSKILENDLASKLDNSFRNE